MNPFRPRFHIADFLKFTAILCVILALFAWSGVDLAFRNDWPMSVLYPLGLAVLCAFSFMRRKVTYPRCESCGKRIFPAWSAEPNARCRACRIPQQSPQERRHLAIQGFIII